MELEQTIKSDLHRALELLNDISIDNSELNAELSHLEDFVKLLNKNYNLVLTGAPGTGKTILAKQIAAAMVGHCAWSELSAEQKAHIRFVQFHPSYDYTDFVEGLRPTPDGNFVRMDGAFKDFCKIANTCSTNSWPTKIIRGDTSFETIYQTMVDDVKHRQIVAYERRSGSKAELHVDENGRIRYHMAQTKAQSEENLKLLYEYFLSIHETDVQHKTESYYFDLISKLTAGRDKPTKTIDYVEYSWMLQQLLNRAYKVEDGGLEINDYDHPHAASNSPYVFIIDEINRGELSKIFGELFFSIDPGYRGEDGTVQTQYQNLVPTCDVFAKGFYVPKNVYIIGTMNDIDRGVEAMDFAIRRRFAWSEITAEDSATSMGITGLTKTKMDALNNALLDRGLTSAFFIGGAYFRKVEGNDFESLWKYHLKGIVSEYFRGNPEADESIECVYNAYMNANIAAPTTVKSESEETEEAN